MKATKCATLFLFLSLCVQRTAAQMTGQPNSLATAVCPPTKDAVLAICGTTCETDEECDPDLKCCPNNCGENSCTKIEIPTPAPAEGHGNDTTVTPTSSGNNDTNTT